MMSDTISPETVKGIYPLDKTKRKLTYVGIIEDSVIMKNDWDEIFFVHKEDVSEVIESLLIVENKFKGIK